MALKLLILFGSLTIIFNFAAGFLKGAGAGARASSRTLLGPLSNGAAGNHAGDFPIGATAVDPYGAHLPGGEMYISGGAMDTFDADDVIENPDSVD